NELTRVTTRSTLASLSAVNVAPTTKMPATSMTKRSVTGVPAATPAPPTTVPPRGEPRVRARHRLRFRNAAAEHLGRGETAKQARAGFGAGARCRRKGTAAGADAGSAQQTCAGLIGREDAHGAGSDRGLHALEVLCRRARDVVVAEEVAGMC